MDNSFTFALISDTHLGRTPSYCYRGVAPADNLEKVLSEIASLPVKPAFLIHTGDVCGDKESEPVAESYSFANSVLGKLNLPLYYVAGNHDNPDLMRLHLSMGEKQDLLNRKSHIVYTFRTNGVLSIVLDARLEGRLSGLLPDDQLKLLEELLNETTDPCMIFLHYPPIELGSKWIDSEMLVTNGDALLSRLIRNRHKILGVFFGHAHHSMQIVHNGLTFISCPSTVFQFSLQSKGRPLDLDPNAPTGFHLVTVTPRGLKITIRTIPSVG